MPKCTISTCVWVILFVITVCVVGYMIVNGTTRGCGSCGGARDVARDVAHDVTHNVTLEGMSPNISGDVYKNSAKIELLTEKMDDIKGVKGDLEEIRSKLKGNSKQISLLTEHMMDTKKESAAGITSILE